MSAGTSPSTPMPTAAYAPMPTASARTSRNSSAPRRRRCTKPMRRRGLGHQPVVPVSVGLGLLVLGEVLDGARASSRSSASMPSLDLAGVEVGEPVELRRRWSRRARRGRSRGSRRRCRGRSRRCRPARRRSTGPGSTTSAATASQPSADHDGERRGAAWPGVAARRARGVAGGLGVERVAGDRDGASSGSSAGTGSSSPVSPERWPRNRPPLAAALAALGGGADEQRPRARRVLGVAGVEHVGDQAGDVVGAAGLEAGADQLDRGVVRAAAGEDVGEPAVVEHAAGAVAAQQQPVAGLELEHEQVGLEVVDAVDRLEDQVAVRVDPRLLLGDPALVDQASARRCGRG